MLNVLVILKKYVYIRVTKCIDKPIDSYVTSIKIAMLLTFSQPKLNVYLNVS